jgi:hypothetical protein
MQSGAWMLLLGTILAAFPSDPSMIGYVRDGAFHPLMAWDGGSLLTEHIVERPLGGRLGYVIDESRSDFVLDENVDYIDPYTEEPGRFANVMGRPAGPVVFAHVGGEPQEISLRADSTLAHSFYRAFAKDRWGSRLLRNADLETSLSEIALASNVITYGTTDLDADGHPEIWVTYQLMYGEIGAMLWEEGPQGWARLVNHCYICD